MSCMCIGNQSRYQSSQMTLLTTYLINLDGSKSRLESASGILAKAGLSYIRVPAFDGRKMRPEMMPLYDHSASLRAYGRAMQGGEIGCYLSHLDCLKRFLADGSDFGLVVEDDILISEQAIPIFNDLVAWLGAHRETNWDVINLVNPAKKFYTKLHGFADPCSTERVLCRAHYFPISTAALLWSRRGAARFLEELEVIEMPVDAAVRVMCGERDSGLAFRPALFSRVEFHSEIDAVADRSLMTGGWRQYYAIQTWRMKYRLLAIWHMLTARRR